MSGCQMHARLCESGVAEAQQQKRDSESVIGFVHGDRLHRGGGKSRIRVLFGEMVA